MTEQPPESAERWRPVTLSLKQLWPDLTLTVLGWAIFVYALLYGDNGRMQLVGYSRHYVIGVMGVSVFYLVLLNRAEAVREWLTGRGWISERNIDHIPLSLQQAQLNYVVTFRGFLLMTLLIGVQNCMQMVTLPIPEGVSLLSIAVLLSVVGYTTTYIHTGFDVRVWAELSGSCKRRLIQRNKWFGFVHYLTAASLLLSYLVRTKWSVFIVMGFIAVSAVLSFYTLGWLIYFTSTHRADSEDLPVEGSDAS